MIKRLVHFSDLHIRLFKDHELYKSILTNAFDEWRALAPDRIVFTGDLVHSKNQMTPELIDVVAWVLTECSKIAKTVLIIGNHDFLENNTQRTLGINLKTALIVITSLVWTLFYVVTSISVRYLIFPVKRKLIWLGQQFNRIMGKH